MSLENPDNFESLLQRFRPVGPPPGLRSKILAIPIAAPRRWPVYLYRAAIAATLLLSLSLLHAADALNAANATRIGSGPVEWTPDAQAAADLLGPGAQRYIALCLLDRP
jgi:hypothetical protein